MKKKCNLEIRKKSKKQSGLFMGDSGKARNK